MILSLWSPRKNHTTQRDWMKFGLSAGIQGDIWYFASINYHYFRWIVSFGPVMSQFGPLVWQKHSLVFQPSHDLFSVRKRGYRLFLPLKNPRFFPPLMGPIVLKGSDRAGWGWISSIHQRISDNNNWGAAGAETRTWKSSVKLFFRVEILLSARGLLSFPRQPGGFCFGFRHVCEFPKSMNKIRSVVFGPYNCSRVMKSSSRWMRDKILSSPSKTRQSGTFRFSISKKRSFTFSRTFSSFPIYLGLGLWSRSSIGMQFCFWKLRKGTIWGLCRPVLCDVIDEWGSQFSLGLLTEAHLLKELQKRSCEARGAAWACFFVVEKLERFKNWYLGSKIPKNLKSSNKFRFTSVFPVWIIRVFHMFLSSFRKVTDPSLPPSPFHRHLTAPYATDTAPDVSGDQLLLALLFSVFSFVRKPFFHINHP